MYYILLIIGFILLIKGADYFVTGSSNLAKSLKVSSLIIGLTIVSFGTSAPETVVSTLASIKGSNDISISNVIGSNIFNILIVLGTLAFIKTLTTKKDIIKRDFIAMITSFIILLIFMSDNFLNIDNNDVISRGESIVLFLLFVAYLYIIFLNSNNTYKKYEIHKLSILDILMLLLGALAIIVGGELVVKTAKEISINLGVSETVVGLTIVSIGTSLPELVTSLVAAYKKETDIAIGNVIGSNIYNTLLVIGISGTVSEIGVSYYAILDIMFLIIISIIIYIIIIKYKEINKKTGIIMIIAYIIFIIYILKR